MVGKDELSFTHPLISTDDDWKKQVKGHLEKAERLAHLVEKLPDEVLHRDFSDAKYGSYFRNLHGLVEHTHYHLGQIALIKKLLRSSS